MGWIQVTPGVILSNVIPPNNLLLNSYFENLTIGLQYFPCLQSFKEIRDQ